MEEARECEQKLAKPTKSPNYYALQHKQRTIRMSVLRLSPKHVNAPERSPRSGNVERAKSGKRCENATFSTPAGNNLELLAIAYATWGWTESDDTNPQCESAGGAAILHTNCDNVCAQAELGRMMVHSTQQERNQ